MHCKLSYWFVRGDWPTSEISGTMWGAVDHSDSQPPTLCQKISQDVGLAVIQSL